MMAVEPAPGELPCGLCPEHDAQVRAARVLWITAAVRLEDLVKPWGPLP